MNSSEKIRLRVDENTFFYWSTEINFYLCSLITVIGLICNCFTVFIIKAKPKQAIENIRVNFQHHPGYRTSKKYMLAIAVSDSLFLISHLIEDIMPSISPNPFYQIVNQYDFACKLTLYIRNGSRMCSSYLVVLFAWERYVVIKEPLKRLRFHSHNVTRNVILIVYAVSYSVCLYTLVISGIRLADHIDNDTEPNKSANSYTNLYECDTKIEYKNSYDYISLVYINSGLLIPILFLCFFNFSIVYVLFTRKNEIYRQTFSTSTSFNRSKPIVYRFKSTNSLSSSHSKKLSYNGNQSISILKQKSISMNSIKKKKEDVAFKSRNFRYKSKSECFEKFTIKPMNKERTNSASLQNQSHRQISVIKKSLKDSDRATLILIVLSALFVILNVPYICAWLFFYIPYIRNELNMEQTYFRFALLLIVEILHVLNFSIAFFSYCAVSKLFRKDILHRVKIF